MILQKEEISKLTQEEKSKLVCDILEMIEDEMFFNDDNSSISKEEMDIVDERIEKLKKNPDASRPWKEVRKELKEIVKSSKG